MDEDRIFTFQKDARANHNVEPPLGPALLSDESIQSRNPRTPGRRAGAAVPPPPAARRRRGVQATLGVRIRTAPSLAADPFEVWRPRPSVPAGGTLAVPPIFQTCRISCVLHDMKRFDPWNMLSRKEGVPCTAEHLCLNLLPF